MTLRTYLASLWKYSISLSSSSPANILFISTVISATPVVFWKVLASVHHTRPSFTALKSANLSDSAVRSLMLSRLPSMVLL